MQVTSWVISEPLRLMRIRVPSTFAPAATGVLYNAAGKELGDRIFHDFAGWMMMPLALGLLLLELKILDWVFLEDLGQASREDVIRMGVKPAHLFMTSFEGAGKPSKPPAVKPPAPRPPQGQGR